MAFVESPHGSVLSRRDAMRLVSTMKKAVRDRLLARAGGLDLTRLDKVPDTLS